MVELSTEKDSQNIDFANLFRIEERRYLHSIVLHDITGRNKLQILLPSEDGNFRSHNIRYL